MKKLFTSFLMLLLSITLPSWQIITVSTIDDLRNIGGAGIAYYISPSGNDATGNGSQGNPWKTLYKATSIVTTAGDAILVLPGTYNETQTSNLRPGVSIRGEGYATTVINVSITSQWSSFISLSSPQNTNGNQEISGLTLNGKYTSESSKGTWVAIWVTGRSNVLIHDIKFTNFYASAAIFDGFDATSPSKDPGVTATGNKFYNNNVNNCSGVVDQQYGNGSLMIGGQTGMEISNNSIICTGRPNLLNGWPIKYYDNGYLKGCRITGNTLVKAPYMAGYWGQGGDWDFAIELFNIQGLEIYNNNIQGAIDLNYNYKGSYAYSVWIHGNNLNHATPNYTHPESGIIFEFATQSALVENNVFNNKFVGISYNLRTPGNTGGYTYGCPSGGCSEVTNNIIRNNLFTNLYQAPYGASGGIITQTEGGTNDVYITNMQVYNNTFVAKASGAAPTGLDFTSQNNGTVTGVSIYNNIFQGFAGGSITGQKAKTQSSISISNNDYYLCSTPVWSGATITGNLNLNPQFDASYISQNTALNGIGWKGDAIPPPSCSYFGYYAWSACDNNNRQTRLWYGLPTGCIGNPPADSISRPCTSSNIPPLADAGPDHFFSLPTTSVTLNGNGTDLDGIIVSYKWTSTGGTFSNANVKNPEFSVTASGIYIVTLTVTDNHGASGRDTMKITVDPEIVPNDTIPCTVILHGQNLSRKNVTYIIKKPDGYYDKDIKRSIYLYRRPDGKWMIFLNNTFVQYF